MTVNRYTHEYCTSLTHVYQLHPFHSEASLPPPFFFALFQPSTQPASSAFSDPFNPFNPYTLPRTPSPPTAHTIVNVHTKAVTRLSGWKRKRRCEVCRNYIQRHGATVSVLTHSKLPPRCNWESSKKQKSGTKQKFQ